MRSKDMFKSESNNERHRFQLMKGLGIITYLFCGTETVIIALQLILLLTFVRKELLLFGISISVDFASLFLFLLSYMLLGKPIKWELENYIAAAVFDLSQFNFVSFYLQ